MYGEVAPGPGARETILRTGPGRVRPISVGNPGITGPLSSMGGRLMGWCIRENTGTGTASFNLYDGGDSSEQIVAAVSLAAGATTMISFSPDGIDIESGLYFSTVSGQVRGVVYYRMDVPGAA